MIFSNPKRYFSHHAMYPRYIHHTHALLYHFIKNCIPHPIIIITKTKLTHFMWFPSFQYISIPQIFPLELLATHCSLVKPLLLRRVPNQLLCKTHKTTHPKLQLANKPKPKPSHRIRARPKTKLYDDDDDALAVFSADMNQLPRYTYNINIA